MCKTGEIKLKKVWHLKKWCEDYSTSIAKLEGCEELRQYFVFAKILRERVKILTQVLEKLLLLCRLLNLHTHKYFSVLSNKPGLTRQTQNNLKYLYLFQKQTALHKAVAHEASWRSAVQQEFCRVGSNLWVCPHQLTVMRD